MDRKRCLGLLAIPSVFMCAVYAVAGPAVKVAVRCSPCRYNDDVGPIETATQLTNTYSLLDVFPPNTFLALLVIAVVSWLVTTRRSSRFAALGLSIVGFSALFGIVKLGVQVASIIVRPNGAGALYRFNWYRVVYSPFTVTQVSVTSHLLVGLVVAAIVTFVGFALTVRWRDRHVLASRDRQSPIHGA